MSFCQIKHSKKAHQCPQNSSTVLCFGPYQSLKDFQILNNNHGRNKVSNSVGFIQALVLRVPKQSRQLFNSNKVLLRKLKLNQIDSQAALDLDIQTNLLRRTKQPFLFKLIAQFYHSSQVLIQVFPFEQLTKITNQLLQDQKCHLQLRELATNIDSKKIQIVGMSFSSFCFCRNSQSQIVPKLMPNVKLVYNGSGRKVNLQVLIQLLKNRNSSQKEYISNQTQRLEFMQVANFKQFTKRYRQKYEKSNQSLNRQDQIKLKDKTNAYQNSNQFAPYKPQVFICDQTELYKPTYYQKTQRPEINSQQKQSSLKIQMSFGRQLTELHNQTYFYHNKHQNQINSCNYRVPLIQYRPSILRQNQQRKFEKKTSIHSKTTQCSTKQTLDQLFLQQQISQQIQQKQLKLKNRFNWQQFSIGRIEENHVKQKSDKPIKQQIKNRLNKQNADDFALDWTSEGGGCHFFCS